MPHSFVSLILLDEININVAKVSLNEKIEGALTIFRRSKKLFWRLLMLLGVLQDDLKLKMI